jgi:hypothetical protein
MKFGKQITALRNKRNVHLDAMTALSDLAETGERLFTEDEQKAFDKDQAEVRDIDGTTRLPRSVLSCATLYRSDRPTIRAGSSVRPSPREPRRRRPGRRRSSTTSS